ncbi:hypothetical protein SAY87_026433 [Trapa incisa]|uniref:Uncharacterized protein n=1 Tax=Trapa incisa TaxID=236973 RepID=A0AAN7GUH4_9MYRT|nr:hypothetical protein SAY87_026433 [Trapa incisa]
MGDPRKLGRLADPKAPQVPEIRRWYLLKGLPLSTRGSENHLGLFEILGIRDFCNNEVNE